MVLVVTVVILVAGAVILARRGGAEGDAPERLAALAASQLPAERRDWGLAMAAELTDVRGQVPRWRFACGMLRIALFPPVRHRIAVLTVATAGLAVAVAGTLLAANAVPTMAAFTAALGLLLGGYATMVAWRWRSGQPPLPHLVAGGAALAGASAAVTAAVRIAIARPAATADGTHLFAILFAVELTGCLSLVLTPPRLGSHSRTVLWGALAGALACTAAWVIIALAGQFSTEQVTGYFSPVSAAAVLVVTSCVAASSRSMPAGAKAGVLTAVLGAPIHFAIDMTALLQVRHFALTSPFDMSAYARGGYPTVASYLISDTLGGYIITGMLLYPIALTGLAILVAAATARLRPTAAGSAD